MRNIRHLRVLCILFMLIATIQTICSQGVLVSGIVKDAQTSETLPLAAVTFKGTTIGTATDENGLFKLESTKGYDSLKISSLGYEDNFVPLKKGENLNLEILLKPISIEVGEVVVKPKREHYSRKNNPAVELIKKVIENKERNHVESRDVYKVECYEKTSLALDNFNPNFEKNKLLKKFNFLKNYTDTSEFTGGQILTLSVRESLSDIYYRKSPKSKKTYILAQSQQGVDKTLDQGGALTANLNEIIKGVDIFDNDIDFLMNRFVSPLSSTLANAYYHYYILDTVTIDDSRYVDLAFTPSNSESYSFTGRLYVSLDGNYYIRRVLLNVPYKINLNYVKALRIEQDFKQMPDSLWVLDEENTYINFNIAEKTHGIYAHHIRSFKDYDFNISPEDSVFRELGETHVLKSYEATQDSFWVNHRHIPFQEKENELNELMTQLRSVPAFNVFIKTIEILVSGYICTGENTSDSKFDFGPMNTTFSGNSVEGFRMRVGGMTTANLNPHFFLSGYVAYGMDDRKWKYNGRFTYSFNKKEYHEGESPLNNLTFMQEYDLYTPGQDFLFTSKDNVFLFVKVGKPITNMTYLRTSLFQYEKEWLNGLTIRPWIKNQNNESAGTLNYIACDDNDRFYRVNDITTTEVGLRLRFAPGEKSFNSRTGKNSIFNLQKNAPVFMLSHQVGLKNIMGGEYSYNHTEFSAKKRIWLSSFGNIDALLKAGKVWDKVPFPLLILPNTNQSLTIQEEAFHLMNALEFVADEYVNLNVTYYLRGLIFNRIPYFNLLQWREVMSFNGIWGNLSDKNNPELERGLFLLPDGTQPIGKTPYMECSFGIDNIFKILRVDYYRRLTYLGHSNINKGGIRIALRFEF